MTLTQDLQYAIDLARNAGKIILEQYGHVQRQTKTHIAATDEAVTEADRASQRLIVAGLRKQFPTDGIIGEESDAGTSITAEINNPLGRNWVIDPIDGTNNFIAGLGNFAVCIGLLDAGHPILGVVYDVTRDLMYAADKTGATANGQKIQALTTPISDSSLVMMTSSLLDKSGNIPAWAVRCIGQSPWKARMLGSAALEAVQVAAGVAHAAITINGKLWDAAAPAALVIAAGGVITTLDGQPIFPFDLRNYQGAKVPFLAAAKSAQTTLLREIQENP
jgi:fructose-1,6-bisphosphatase/inositol monophosphatase family enzyme